MRIIRIVTPAQFHSRPDTESQTEPEAIAILPEPQPQVVTLQWLE